MPRKRDISSITLVDESDRSGASRRALRRRARKPVNVLRRAIISIAFALLGIAAMAAPLLTNYLEYSDYTDAIGSLAESVDALSEDARTEMLNAAYRYNEQFAAGRPVGIEEYGSLLDVSGPVMGLLRIPKTETVLPIYHSTASPDDVHGVVQVGPSADSRGSSLPVGGPSTHSIISNVSSVPSAAQFALIDELEAGDKVALSVCGQELVYVVSEARTVGIGEASSADIVQGSDLLTLVYAAQGDEEGRFVVSAHRIAGASQDALYLGSYDVCDPQKALSIVFFNMSLPQMIMFVAGCAVMMFFVVRLLVTLNDRAPKEMGRLSGDSG